MDRTSRRSLLAGLVASPFAAVPALAAAAPHPDAALLAMAPELDALIAAAHAAGRRCREMEEVISAMVGPRPVRPAERPNHGPEWPAAWDRYETDLSLFRDKQEEMMEAAGYEAMEAAYGEADGAVLRGMERLAEVPATTLDGLMLKARMSNHDHEGLPASIVVDLLAMGGRA